MSQQLISDIENFDPCIDVSTYENEISLNFEVVGLHINLDIKFEEDIKFENSRFCLIKRVSRSRDSYDHREYAAKFIEYRSDYAQQLCSILLGDQKDIACIFDPNVNRPKAISDMIIMTKE